jgi:glycerol-3-phosphate O-acyltransferase
MAEPFFITLKREIGRIFESTANHYLCQLPEKIGFFSNLILKLLFHRVTLAQEQIQVIENLPKNAIIVYVSKYKGRFELYGYYYWYQRLGLPWPRMAFDYRILLLQTPTRLLKIFGAFVYRFFQGLEFPDPVKDGYVHQALADGRCTYLSLFGKRDFYRRYIKKKADPLQILLDVQRRTERPVVVVPQLFFFGKNPDSYPPTFLDMIFGSNQNPRKLKKVAHLFNSPADIFVEVSDPVYLQSFIQTHGDADDDSEQLAHLLRQKLLQQIDRHRQSITGPASKSVEEIRQNILTNDDLQGFMKKHAKRRNISLHKTRSEAVGYLDEIAAKFSPMFINFGATLVRWLVRTMFDGISLNEAGLEKIRLKARQAPVIFVPSHRSHFDYMIMLYVLHLWKIPSPLIFAGKNLSFWPAGPIFRRVGAFFVRRSFKGAVFYTKVFSAYIHRILGEGYNIEVFIEGTRSRSGKLLPPQLGMLNILLEAYQNGACEDLVCAPVYIGYDRVPEEKEYLAEINGSAKKQESVAQVLRARRALKKRHGTIYVKFSDPFLLSDFLQDQGLTPEALSSKERTGACRKLGSRLMIDIDNAAVVTPQSLVAGALLMSSKAMVAFEQIDFHIKTCLDFLYTKNTRLSESLLVDPGNAVAHMLNYYANARIIEAFRSEKDVWKPGDKVKVKENRRPDLEYYKNNAVSFFIPASFTAISILDLDAFQFGAGDLYDRFRFVQDLFVNEFPIDSRTRPEYRVRKNIKTFIDDAILVPHPTLPDTYNITAQGYKKLKIFSGFLKTFFEAYSIVLTYLTMSKGRRDAKKTRLKKIQTLGNMMVKRGEVHRREAVNKIYFQNALDFFSKSGVRSDAESETLGDYQEKMGRYLSLYDR